MSELTDKLYIKNNSVVEEVSLYTTLNEVSNKGINIKKNGINCYAAYGNGENESILNCKVNGQIYKVLKNITSTSEGLVTLKAYRNDESYMQDLPTMDISVGQKFYLNNENAPTIDGYDFVCCDKNNIKIEGLTEIKVYYIPQSIEDRTKTSWKFWGGFNPRGDLFNTDYVNTYGAIDTSFMFYYSQYMTRAPKLNLSNVFNTDSMFSMSIISNIDFNYYDTSKIQNMAQMFKDIPSLTTVKGSIDMSSCTYCDAMFENTGLTGSVHLRNVRRDLDLSNIGCTYIIDSYID